MAERPERRRAGGSPRDAVEPEWEVFVRSDDDDPLRHVGSVSAPAADVASEQATSLFGWCATDVWLCPARAVSRFTTRSLDENAGPDGVRFEGDARARDP